MGGLFCVSSGVWGAEKLTLGAISVAPGVGTTTVILHRAKNMARAMFWSRVHRDGSPEWGAQRGGRQRCCVSQVGGELGGGMGEPREEISSLAPTSYSKCLPLLLQDPTEKGHAPHPLPRGKSSEKPSENSRGCQRAGVKN